MKVTDKVLEIVQDHTRVTDTIDSICYRERHRNAELHPCVQ